MSLKYSIGLGFVVVSQVVNTGLLFKIIIALS